MPTPTDEIPKLEAAIAGLTGLESAMVGRDAELSALLSASDAMRAGRGGVALIIGEPGLGKSRLLSEWKAAQTSNAQLPTSNPQSAIQWAEGRCLSYGQGLAYHLLIDLVHALIDVPPASPEIETRAGLQLLTNQLFREAAIEVFPYLGHLLSLQLDGAALERVRVLDPQALQAQYLAALRRLLQAMASRRPLVLVCDDIHWADPSSTELLAKLMALASDSTRPILFCFVTRPDEDAPGWRLVRAARETGGERLTEISLHPLTEADSRQLVANLLEVEALPDHIRAIILQKAEGNPFFVEEVIRLLIDHGAIVPRGEGRGWIAGKEIETVEIPDSLQGLVLARIDRLPEEARRTLQVASVIGRQFAVKVLEQVMARP